MLKASSKTKILLSYLCSASDKLKYNLIREIQMHALKCNMINKNMHIKGKICKLIIYITHYAHSVASYCVQLSPIILCYYTH